MIRFESLLSRPPANVVVTLTALGEGPATRTGRSDPERERPVALGCWERRETETDIGRGRGREAAQDVQEPIDILFSRQVVDDPRA
jgi:hypothetical protein